MAADGARQIGGTSVPTPSSTRVVQAEALASSAVRAAEKSQAKILIVFTVTGNTARMIAKYKPKQPILTVG